MTKFRFYYKIGDRLGRGNYATVFAIKRKKDSQLFAAKIFQKKKIVGSEIDRKCLINEIEILRKMDHPAVIGFRELYQGDNYVYCVTDLYQGRNLSKELKNGAIKEKKALRIIFNILKGLEYMHQQGIMHRDIKPENILFKSQRGTDLVLIDFGFATYEKNYNKLLTRCGTPGYVAPEVLNNQKYTKKIDIYSTGIILYCLITGKLPFNNESYQELVRQNMESEIDFDLKKKGIKVGDQTLKLLKGMLERNAFKRLSANAAIKAKAFGFMRNGEETAKRRGKKQ